MPASCARPPDRPAEAPDAIAPAVPRIAGITVARLAPPVNGAAMAPPAPKSPLPSPDQNPMSVPFHLREQRVPFHLVVLARVLRQSLHVRCVRSPFLRHFRMLGEHVSGLRL